MSETYDIVISRGHSDKVPGAAGNYGYSENDLTKPYTKRITEILIENNIKAVDFYEDKAKDKKSVLNNIIAFHKSKDRKLDVSVHFNALNDKSANGCEVLTKKNIKTASALSAAISKAGGLKNRGYKTPEMLGRELGFLNMHDQAVLLEVGFVTNSGDTDKMVKKQEEICNAVAFILARTVSDNPKDITASTWKTGKISSDIEKIDITQITKVSSGTGEYEEGDEGSEFASLSDGVYTDDGFQTTVSGSIVVIDKLPSQQTPAEPIYPDLIQPQVEPEDFVEVTNTILKEAPTEDDKGYVEITLSDMVQRGIDVAKLFFTYEDFLEKTVTHDTNEHRYKEKAGNFKSPVNHSDPFPVDEKIEELQQHIPFAKIHRLWFEDPHAHTVTLAKVVMDLSDKVEKRMAQVENNLAYVYRNLFRIGARMQVNCVYYGGQSEYSKYQTIRCLHSDRLEDGQVMTLDQCLNCTRYEPILGKVYEIENELGISLESINDDNQMSYQTMQNKIEQDHNEKKTTVDFTKKFIDTKKLTKRNEDDKDFKDIWGEGFVMDWTPVPLEQQSPHVRYDDGSTSKMLDSNYKHIEKYNDPTGAGFSGAGIFYGPQSSTFYSVLGYGGGTTAFGSSSLGSSYAGSLDMQGYDDIYSVIKANVEAMDKQASDEFYAKAKKENASKVTATLKNMDKFGYREELISIANKHGVDPILLLSIIVVESGGNPNLIGTSYLGLTQSHSRADYGSQFNSWSTAQRITNSLENACKVYLGKLSAVKSKNPMLGIVCYNAGQGMVIGTSKAGKGGGKATNIYKQGVSESRKESLLFTEVRKPIVRNAVAYFGQHKNSEVSMYFPRVAYAYMKLFETAGMGGIRGRHDKLGGQSILFPYKDEETKNSQIFLTRAQSSYKDETTGKQYAHKGMDLKNKDGADIVAVADGKLEKVVTKDPERGNYVIINHGTFKTSYSHLKEFGTAINQGADVKKGKIIGKEGSSGKGTTEGHHLHFEILVSGESIDPVAVYSFLKGQVSVNADKAITFPV